MMKEVLTGTLVTEDSVTSEIDCSVGIVGSSEPNLLTVLGRELGDEDREEEDSWFIEV